MDFRVNIEYPITLPSVSDWSQWFFYFVQKSAIDKHLSVEELPDEICFTVHRVRLKYRLYCELKMMLVCPEIVFYTNNWYNLDFNIC